MRNSLAKFGLGVILCLAVSGCAKKFNVCLFPHFYDPQLKMLAVAEFQSNSPSPIPGKQFAHRLAVALVRNGTYMVSEPVEPLGGYDDPQIDAMVDKLAGKAQAVIIGGHEVEVYAGYPFRGGISFGVGGFSHGSRYGGHGGRWTWDDYFDGYYVNSVIVRTWASMIALPSGDEIHSTPNIEVIVEDDPWPAGDSIEELVDRALTEAADRLVEQFAIVSKQIEVNPREALRTADARTDHGWRFTDDFSSTADEMFIVLTLPDEADRNTFEVVIRRDDDKSKRTLTGAAIVWDRRDEELVLTFSPKRIAEAGGGTGEYRAVFNSQGKEVFNRDFDIRAPKLD